MKSRQRANKLARDEKNAPQNICRLLLQQELTFAGVVYAGAPPWV
jgi:hypothetical protein